MSDDGLHLPPGFRFVPTDNELVTHYLLRKCAGQPISVPIIAEIDLYKFDPWELPEMASYGEKEWYFFSPRDRKYPNGSRPNRAAGNGYWKATGADKPIGAPSPVAIKKSLVFYSGKAPNAEKTNWIMHEYRLAGVDRSIRKKDSTLRLDDWVLCRIYNKKGAVGNQATLKRPRLEAVAPSPPPSVVRPKAEVICFGTPESGEYIQFDSLELKPRLGGCGGGDGDGGDELISSKHNNVFSSSEESACDVDAESQVRWRGGWDWEQALAGCVPPTRAFYSPSFQDAYLYPQESS